MSQAAVFTWMVIASALCAVVFTIVQIRYATAVAKSKASHAELDRLLRIKEAQDAKTTKKLEETVEEELVAAKPLPAAPKDLGETSVIFGKILRNNEEYDPTLRQNARSMTWGGEEIASYVTDHYTGNIVKVTNSSTDTFSQYQSYGPVTYFAEIETDPARVSTIERSSISKIVRKIKRTKASGITISDRGPLRQK